MSCFACPLIVYLFFQGIAATPQDREGRRRGDAQVVSNKSMQEREGERGRERERERERESMCAIVHPCACACGPQGGGETWLMFRLTSLHCAVVCLCCLAFCTHRNSESEEEHIHFRESPPCLFSMCLSFSPPLPKKNKKTTPRRQHHKTAPTAFPSLPSDTSVLTPLGSAWFVVSLPLNRHCWGHDA